MKKVLRIFWPSVEKTVQLPVEVSPDAKAMERVNTVSPFILESQKHYFDSLKFSLNLWTAIHSGMAIALVGSNVENNKISILFFMIGVIYSAALSIKLTQHISSVLNLYLYTAVEGVDVLTSFRTSQNMYSLYQKQTRYHLFIVYTLFGAGISSLIFL